MYRFSKHACIYYLGCLVRSTWVLSCSALIIVLTYTGHPPQHRALLECAPCINNNTFCDCRRNVSGCIQPRAVHTCFWVGLMWTPLWLWPDRLSASPTGRDTQNCECEDTSGPVTATQITLILIVNVFSAGSQKKKSIYLRKIIFNRFNLPWKLLWI